MYRRFALYFVGVVTAALLIAGMMFVVMVPKQKKVEIGVSEDDFLSLCSANYGSADHYESGGGKVDTIHMKDSKDINCVGTFTFVNEHLKSIAY